LSRETEQSEGPSSLPPPELNPLLNPLLGQNMGRWAQVYFTSPPEKRDEAVHELLRELEAENPTVATPSSATPSSATEPGSEPVRPPAAQAPEVQPTLVRCHACGRKNPSSQRFCGLCGTRLAEEAAVANLHRGNLPGEDSQTVDRHIVDRHIEDRHIENPPPDEPAPFVQTPGSPFTRPDHDVYESRVHQQRLNTNELSLFQSGGDVDYYNEDSDEILSTPRASGSYRIYVGLVVAIFIGALAYVAWRSSQAPSQTSHVEAPSGSTEEPVSSAPVPSSPSKTDIPDSATSAENPMAGSSREPAEPVRKQARTGAHRAALAARRIPTSEKKPQAEISGGSGADELAVAQGYLNGTNGQGRNSAEAAKWLWKAIAKHNADATFLLSEMYLRGNGVSKNCDQARVLLDTAALKGVKGAGERLRHLQAFGCQ
jgi:hypothetical protein